MQIIPRLTWLAPLLVAMTGCQSADLVTTSESPVHRGLIESEPDSAVRPAAFERPEVQSGKVVAQSVDSMGMDLRPAVEPIGVRLASVANSKTDVAFQFGTLHNPRPQVCHTMAGHVSISSGMLEKLETTEELAAVLALEMAELIVERRRDETRSVDVDTLPGVGPDDEARKLASILKLEKAQQPGMDAEVRRLAQVLLDRAGFGSVKVMEICQRHQEVAACHSSARS